MGLYTTEVGSDNVIRVTGDLTMYTIKSDWWQEQGKQQIKSLSQQSPIVFNLEGLTRSDSAGLAWLINIVRDSRTQGFSVKFTNIPTELANLAKISDASPLLPLQ